MYVMISLPIVVDTNSSIHDDQGYHQATQESDMQKRRAVCWLFLLSLFTSESFISNFPCMLILTIRTAIMEIHSERHLAIWWRECSHMTCVAGFWFALPTHQPIWREAKSVASKGTETPATCSAVCHFLPLVRNQMKPTKDLKAPKLSNPQSNNQNQSTTKLVLAVSKQS